MVHVLDLLGCIAQGPTTEAALDATPGAIRAYLRFLRRHGEQVEPDGAFGTVVVEHVMEGPWLGNGNPAPGFGPDSAAESLGADELAVYLRRLTWLRADLLQRIGDMPCEQLVAEPETHGRSIYHILEHVAESQYAYLRAVLGKVDGLPAALRAVRQGPEGVASALHDAWRLTSARLEAMTGAERAKVVQRGQVTWMARRMLRRMLEHEWEHLLEIAGRFGEPLG